MNLVALNAENFASFESLFTPEGSGCYCAVWRTHDETWERRCRDPKLPNLSLAKNFVKNGSHWGFLAFEKETLIGWTASGPKTEFPLLRTKLGSRATPFDSNIWSIGCIAFNVSYLTDERSVEIIESVIKKARLANAHWIEAYPTDPWDELRSYRGSHRHYEQLGFEKVASEKDENSEILCMRLKL